MILLNMPNDVSDLVKVRYVYMKFGSLFSYDFKIVMDEDIASTEVKFDEIGKYQTCVQIAQILNVVLNNINKNCKAKIITREGPGCGRYKYQHVANEIRFTDEKTGIEYKLLLDLTLDLFRIQSGLQTMQFAYTTDSLGSYDIITDKECNEMDKELGFIKKENREKQILEIREELSKSNLSMKDKIQYMWDKLYVYFNGAHEARQYFEYLISKIFYGIEYHIYSLYYAAVSETQFVSLFIIKGEEDIYLLVDNNLGMMLSSKDNVNNMLSFGWRTSSKTLFDVVGYEPDIGKVVKRKK